MISWMFILLHMVSNGPVSPGYLTKLGYIKHDYMFTWLVLLLSVDWGCSWGLAFILFKMGFHYVVYSGLELLDWSNPSASESLVSGIIGMYHCIWPPWTLIYVISYHNQQGKYSYVCFTEGELIVQKWSVHLARGLHCTRNLRPRWN